MSVSTDALQHHLLQQYREAEEEGSQAGRHLCVYLVHDQLSICSQLEAGVYKGEDYVKWRLLF